MLVSIIVPFYNVEHYFIRCLESIIHQSYQNLEIILIDDCSPDNSITIARDYAGKDSRIHIIEHTQNLGLGGARNSGLSIARGEYIWFIDSDDEITSPYAVEHLVSVARRDSADIVLFNAQYLMENETVKPIWSVYAYAQEQIFNENRPFYPIFYDVIKNADRRCTGLTTTVWASFFRRLFITQYEFKFLEHTLYEDIPSLMLYPLARRITQLPNVYYNYALRDGSIMRSNKVVNHLEHLERIAARLWGMYDIYWDQLDDKEIIVSILLIHHSLYNINRTFHQLNISQQNTSLRMLYDFLKNQLMHRINFENFAIWPKVMTNQAQWKIFFCSWNEILTDKQKIIIMQNILFSKSYPLEGNILHVIKFHCKKIIKMLLPYGFVRYIQISKTVR
ncbi:glycosyltransferase family 2 protein [Entomospira nematocerorum]|uniref:Glycosyltransferase family 2 protein n=1 Tax=Entomospira nematocerorum TaxID=2719987 RepID=A0A968GFP6_9SPIO|nr:glycosyltransferase family 2 protein [Entomospira nematocera]NIZ47398.1 glycosyltransferase family 2 protein [Entomospira nematocera]WDI34062.1 glycosyltransferase family 2 protein [Entomospira nematocera]